MISPMGITSSKFTSGLIQHAMTLAETHASCGYDAVQLAAALTDLITKTSPAL